MAPILRIEDNQQYLCVHVSEAKNWWRMTLSILVGGIVLYFAFHSESSLKLPKSFVVGLVVLSIIWEVGSHLRGTQVSFTATNLEFTSAGHSPMGYKPSSVPRADITNIEFRRASGGVDTTAYPQGLYVEYRDRLWNGLECVLPQIDENQAEEVMTVIYSRFPDTGELASPDPQNADLILLNLSQPKRE